VVLPALRHHRPPLASWVVRAGTTGQASSGHGHCTLDQHAEFIRQAPLFEQMLVNDGISLTKLWFR
jgi:polyphosphate kinase 2 (PPK2 family)